VADLDAERIRHLSGIIAEALNKLRELARVAKEEFLKDFRNTESAKYLLVVATGAAIDICNHIVVKQGGRAPKDYADCFVALKELGVISANLAKRLVKMARFRNLLVHLYWQVDNEKVFEIIRRDLDDLEEFQKQVASYISKAGGRS